LLFTAAGRKIGTLVSTPNLEPLSRLADDNEAFARIHLIRGLFSNALHCAL